MGSLFWKGSGLGQHWDVFEPGSVKNGIFAYMMVGFPDRLRLKTMFSLIWGYCEPGLYSQKQQNHKLDRSRSLNSATSKNKIAIGAKIAINRQRILRIDPNIINRIRCFFGKPCFARISFCHQVIL